ncbi:MAG: hypothetical protein HY718_05730 [Planctomycetes bacterium]|nr:hypothetical protein [Planctomycetota bacterium]
MARKLKLDLGDLAEAMSWRSDESEYYLDTHTGKIILVESGMLTDLEDGEEIDEDLPEWQKPMLAEARAIVEDTQDRYESIPPIESREGFRIMEDFIPGLTDDTLRDRLWEAIRGKGAFRRFKDALANAGGDLLDQWHRYEEQRHRDMAREWLESLDIEPEDSPAD